MAITVKIADYKTASTPEILQTYGLGSCVAVILYDSISHIGGLSHFMLPNSHGWNNIEKKPGKFVDLSVKLLLDDMKNLGASRLNLQAKLVGGASMFKNITDSGSLAMGQRNIEAAREVLEQLRIKVVAEDVGKDYGRSVFFYTETGVVKVRSIYAGEISI